MFSKVPSKRPAAAGSGPSRVATGFTDTSSRPNSAPLQVGGAPQIGGSALLQPTTATHPSNNNNNSTEGLSLVEQRLRIVKRNRSRSTDEGDNSMPITSSPLSAPSPSVALPPSVAPLVANFPAQDLTAIPKHDKTQLESMVSDVVFALFFADGATSS